MTKRTVYTLFILKFLFSLLLIFWTIKMTMSADIFSDIDKSFLSTFSDVDINYNNMNESNILFNKKFDVKIIINDFTIDKLSFQDIYLSRRVITKRDTFKNILKYNGKNNITIVVMDKNTNKVIDNIETNIILTRPSTNKDDMKIKIDKLNQKISFNIDKKSYWNIIGTIKVDTLEGHFYYKTNSK